MLEFSGHPYKNLILKLENCENDELSDPLKTGALLASLTSGDQGKLC